MNPFPDTQPMGYQARIKAPEAVNEPEASALHDLAARCFAMFIGALAFWLVLVASYWIGKAILGWFA